MVVMVHLGKALVTELRAFLSLLRRHARLFIGAIVLLALLAGAGIWLGWFGPQQPSGVLVVSGDIEAHESLLSFKTVQSRIVILPFDEGATVPEGMLLARVDDADYRQQVAIAQAALDVQTRQLDATAQSVTAAQQTVANDVADLAEKTLDAGRDQALLLKQAIATQARDLAVTAQKQSAAALARDQALEKVSERNVDLAAANIKDARASLDMAQIVLGYTVLRAPFNGVILVRQAELGESVVPGTPVVTLADLDHVWLRAYINEPDISKVRLGQRVTITTDSYPGKIYRGRISFISSQAEFTPKSVETHAERVTLVYRIKIDLENPSHELVPGLPADAQITLAAAGPT
jgi:HlyD family secretion protein